HLDRLRRRVFEDGVERTHRDLVAPRRRNRCLGLVREIVALLIGLQRETLAGHSNVGDLHLAALGRVPDTFLHGQLLERRELLRTQGREGDLMDVHRAHLAYDRPDPRVVGRHVEYMTAAEAGAPDAQPIGVDLRLQRQPGQGVAVVLDLVTRKQPLARLTATGAEGAVVEYQGRNAGSGETAGERFEEHLLHRTEAVRHSHGGYSGL